MHAAESPGWLYARPSSRQPNLALGARRGLTAPPLPPPDQAAENVSHSATRLVKATIAEPAGAAASAALVRKAAAAPLIVAAFIASDVSWERHRQGAERPRPGRVRPLLLSEDARGGRGVAAACRRRSSRSSIAPPPGPSPISLRRPINGGMPSRPIVTEASAPESHVHLRRARRDRPMARSASPRGARRRRATVIPRRPPADRTSSASTAASRLVRRANVTLANAEDRDMAPRAIILDGDALGRRSHNETGESLSPRWGPQRVRRCLRANERADDHHGPPSRRLRGEQG